MKIPIEFEIVAVRHGNTQTMRYGIKTKYILKHNDAVSLKKEIEQALKEKEYRDKYQKGCVMTPLDGLLKLQRLEANRRRRIAELEDSLENENPDGDKLIALGKIKELKQLTEVVENEVI